MFQYKQFFRFYFLLIVSTSDIHYELDKRLKTVYIYFLTNP